MRFTEKVFGAWRQASAELVTELGYDPADILDERGDGRLDTEHRGRIVVLHVMQRGLDGEAKVHGDRVATRTRRVVLTREQADTYRARTTLDAAMGETGAKP